MFTAICMVMSWKMRFRNLVFCVLVLNNDIISCYRISVKYTKQWVYLIFLGINKNWYGCAKKTKKRYSVVRTFSFFWMRLLLPDRKVTMDVIGFVNTLQKRLKPKLVVSDVAGNRVCNAILFYTLRYMRLEFCADSWWSNQKYKLHSQANLSLGLEPVILNWSIFLSFRIDGGRAHLKRTDLLKLMLALTLSGAGEYTWENWLSEKKAQFSRRN